MTSLAKRLHSSEACDSGIVRQKLTLMFLNEVVLLCICIFTLLRYIAVNTTIIQYDINATCFDLQ